MMIIHMLMLQNMHNAIEIEGKNQQGTFVLGKRTRQTCLGRYNFYK